MYQIGKILEDVSGAVNARMPDEFKEVVKRMLQKSMTAEQAGQMLPDSRMKGHLLHLTRKPHCAEALHRRGMTCN